MTHAQPISKRPVRFSRNAIMAHAIIEPREEDGGGEQFHVFCNLPGGFPWASYDPLSPTGSRLTIVEAPQCMTEREFREFVLERWNGEEVK